jgi:hypothetical protein
LRIVCGLVALSVVNQTDYAPYQFNYVAAPSCPPDAALAGKLPNELSFFVVLSAELIMAPFVLLSTSWHVARQRGPAAHELEFVINLKAAKRIASLLQRNTGDSGQSH